MDAILSPTETATPDVIRYWKDPRYRRNLSAQQLETLPQHPSGSSVLTDEELKAASGMMPGENEFAILTTARDCTVLTFHQWKSCGC